MRWLLEKDLAIKSSITETTDVSPETRLSVYGKGYGYRLIDALSENYPAVHTLLGDESFYQMTYDYMAAHPSHHFSLRYFGSELESFLGSYYKNSPFMAEMARFEWALRHAFDACNTPTITLQDLQAIAVEQWGSLKFKFHPSLKRLDLEWNVPQLWSAVDQNSDPIDAEKNPHPIAWLIWRKELTNFYRSMDVDEAWSIDQASQGESFATLCEGICEWIDAEHAPMRIAGFLTDWINEDLIVAVNTE